MAGGGGYAWFARLRSERPSRVALAMREAEVLHDEAKRGGDDLARWAKAGEAAPAVEGLLADARDEKTRQRITALAESVTAQTKAAENDREFLDKLVDMRAHDSDIDDAAFADAFRNAGIDVWARPAVEVAAAIRARPPTVLAEMAASLDRWTMLRRDWMKDRAGAAALSAVVRAADPDSWRNQLRDSIDSPERLKSLDALRELARTVTIDRLPLQSLDLLGLALLDASDLQAAENVLRKAQLRHPGDFRLNMRLAECLAKLARGDEAIRYYMVARSIRPESAHGLAHALEEEGELDEAIAVFQDLRRRPGAGDYHLLCLARALRRRGRTQEASEALVAAIAASREQGHQTHDAWAYRNLGRALQDQGKLAEAIAQYREAIRIKPDLAATYVDLSSALRDQGKLQEAIVELGAAIRLKPDDASAHHNLGVALRAQGKLEEAIAACRAAIRLQPEHHSSHEDLGGILAQQGNREEAIAEFRTATRTDASCTRSRNILAWTLAFPPNRPQREYEEALIHARKAVELEPGDSALVNTLALAEYRVGHWAESIAASERSMALRNGGDASDWFFLAMAHWQKGGKDGGRKWFDKAVAWTKEKDPKNSELRQFWTEAAELLGQPGPDAPGPASPKAP
jgi:serine/threonine-protein kinase